MSIVKIDGVDYAPVVPTDTSGRKWQIIVAHRGWVFYGHVEDSENEVVIHDAVNIRKWGTTAGIGQLAIGGPTPETILDAAGTVRLHPLTVVCRFDCAGAWK